MKQGKILLTAAALTAVFMLAMNGLSRAADNVPIECPAGAPSCKVVVMTADEINTLTGAGLIFDSALWANRANLQGALDAWRQKLANAPNGNVKAPEAKKPDASKPESKK